VTVIHSDCLDAMRAMPDASVDSIVSDPPYGLAFMGKAWDHGVPGEPFWAEALRVAKPGAYLVAFGGTRTYHRLACAIEDAGWEIRDCLSWLYGSGFPKSHDVSKAMDKAAGAERERYARPAFGGTFSDDAGTTYGTALSNHPATDLARQWQGWGTALKPAWEPIILARKPLVGTVAANVAAHGTGALNVDGCRIGTEARTNGGMSSLGVMHDDDWKPRSVSSEVSGRWPANVCLDEDAAAMLDAQSGISKGSGPREGVRGGHKFGGEKGENDTLVGRWHGDSGGASRFFYTAKASRREREAGLEGMPERDKSSHYGDGLNSATKVRTVEQADVGVDRGSARNHHPTVKPIALMRWLVRLVTPPNGLVLDPFTGSGTTGCAAVLEGFRFLGCEREAEYVAIAEKRIAHWAAQKAPEPEPSLF